MTQYDTFLETALQVDLCVSVLSSQLCKRTKTIEYHDERGACLGECTCLNVAHVVFDVRQSAPYISV